MQVVAVVEVVAGRRGGGRRSGSPAVMQVVAIVEVFAYGACRCSLVVSDRHLRRWGEEGRGEEKGEAKGEEKGEEKGRREGKDRREGERSSR